MISIASLGFRNLSNALVDHGVVLMSPLASVSISEFRSFAALIVAAHHTSLPLAEISSKFFLIPEKKASSARFLPNTIDAATKCGTTLSPLK